ncbi:MAG: hypothetical protein LBV71_05095 [Prevotella sp.]|nr:hypothetical protein [Prevotella sp.]
MKNIIVISILFCFVISCKKQAPSESTVISVEVPGDTITSSVIEYIDADLAVKIKPAIEGWLKFYNLDISDFQKGVKSTMDVDKLKKDTTYAYYNYIEYTKDRDVYTPQFYDYSPDKSMYLNIMEATFVYLAEDGKYHYAGSDDSQGITLFNRKDKSAVLITYRGYSDSADAVFWVDNQMFIIAGYAAVNDPGEFTLEVYDLKEKTKNRYIFPKEYTTGDSYLMTDMKRRNIIID